MKKIAMIVVIGLVVCCLASLSYAHYDGYKNNIKEGFAKIVKSPLTFSDEVKVETTNAKFKPFGVVGGIAKGSYYGLKDIVSGAIRILTFSVEDDNYFVNKFKKTGE